MRARFIVPGGVDDVTGGNVYDAAAIASLRARGWQIEVAPSGEDSDADVVVVDSLAFHMGSPRTDAPVIALAHQLPSEAAGREPTDAERATLRGADAVVTVGRWLAARVRELGARAIHVVPPGRDRAWSPEGPRADAAGVLCVANAVPGKGLADAVAAFDRAAPRGVALEIVGNLDRVAGEGRRVREAIAAATVEVRTPGTLSPVDLSKRYAGAVALLTASRYEGWPIAVAEAMASRLVVVGFDVPGVAEVVGDAGLLVEAGDVEALASAVRRVVDDTRLRAELGAAARDRAMAWPTWTETGARFADVAERVVAQASGASNAP